MTESSKIFQQRQQKINEAFRNQRLDLPVDFEPIHRLTEDLVDDEGWNERCRMGKNILYEKGNQRKVVHPDREDLHFEVRLTHETIYEAPKKPRERPIKQPKYIPSQKPGGRKK